MRGVVCAVLALVAAAMFAGRGAGAKSSAAGQQPEKTAEQRWKNIQMLKGLPESQLFPLMNFVSVSLGVKCDYCHVKQGKDPKTGYDNWVWESDDKPEKKSARDMMRMVIALNKSQGFGLGPDEVSCYTCHRGSTRPQLLPTFPLAASGHEAAPVPTPDAAPTPRPTPPTVQQIYERYTAAVGSEQAVATFQTQIVKGTREASQGRSWTYEATIKGPDKFLVVIQIPQQGTISQAINGTSGWMKNAQTERALTPAELGELRQAAELFDVIKFRPTPTMRAIGRRRVGDRDAVIVVDRPAEGVSRRYFFDAQTGLLFRIMTLTDTMLSPIPEQIDFEDYRDVDGVKIPFVVRRSTIDTYDSYTRSVTEIKHGILFEDKVFSMPPSQPNRP